MSVTRDTLPDIHTRLVDNARDISNATDVKEMLRQLNQAVSEVKDEATFQAQRPTIERLEAEINSRVAIFQFLNSFEKNLIDSLPPDVREILIFPAMQKELQKMRLKIETIKGDFSRYRPADFDLARCGAYFIGIQKSNLSLQNIELFIADPSRFPPRLLTNSIISGKRQEMVRYFEQVRADFTQFLPDKINGYLTFFQECVKFDRYCEDWISLLGVLRANVIVPSDSGAIDTLVAQINTERQKIGGPDAATGIGSLKTQLDAFYSGYEIKVKKHLYDLRMTYMSGVLTSAPDRMSIADQLLRGLTSEEREGFAELLGVSPKNSINKLASRCAEMLLEGEQRVTLERLIQFYKKAKDNKRTSPPSADDIALWSQQIQQNAQGNPALRATADTSDLPIDGSKELPQEFMNALRSSLLGPETLKMYSFASHQYYEDFNNYLQGKDSKDTLIELGIPREGFGKIKDMFGSELGVELTDQEARIIFLEGYCDFLSGLLGSNDPEGFLKEKFDMLKTGSDVLKFCWERVDSWQEIVMWLIAIVFGLGVIKGIGVAVGRDGLKAVLKGGFDLTIRRPYRGITGFVGSQVAKMIADGKQTKAIREKLDGDFTNYRNTLLGRLAPNLRAYIESCERVIYARMALYGNDTFVFQGKTYGALTRKEGMARIRGILEAVSKHAGDGVTGFEGNKALFEAVAKQTESDFQIDVAGTRMGKIKNDAAVPPACRHVASEVGKSTAIKLLTCSRAQIDGVATLLRRIFQDTNIPSSDPDMIEPDEAREDLIKAIQNRGITLTPSELRIAVVHACFIMYRQGPNGVPRNLIEAFKTALKDSRFSCADPSIEAAYTHLHGRLAQGGAIGAHEMVLLQNDLACLCLRDTLLRHRNIRTGRPMSVDDISFVPGDDANIVTYSPNRVSEIIAGARGYLNSTALPTVEGLCQRLNQIIRGYPEVLSNPDGIILEGELGVHGLMNTIITTYNSSGISGLDTLINQRQTTNAIDLLTRLQGTFVDGIVGMDDAALRDALLDLVDQTNSGLSGAQRAMIREFLDCHMSSPAIPEADLTTLVHELVLRTVDADITHDAQAQTVISADPTVFARIEGLCDILRVGRTSGVNIAHHGSEALRLGIRR